MAERINYVLVDYENVQPSAKDMELLKDGPFKVKIFLGSNQARLPVALIESLQPLGEAVEYILLESSGKNALDFHIAYYIGILSVAEPRAFFHVISKDTGFDPLLKHLKRKKVFAQRSASISEIPFFNQVVSAIKPALPTVPTEVAKPSKDRVEIAIADLVRRKSSKPGTQKTLLSTINALFKKELSEQQLNGIFDELCKRGIVKLDGVKVSYKLPGNSAEAIE